MGRGSWLLWRRVCLKAILKCWCKAGHAQHELSSTPAWNFRGRAPSHPYSVKQAQRNGCPTAAETPLLCRFWGVHPVCGKFSSSGFIVTTGVPESPVCRVCGGTGAGGALMAIFFCPHFSLKKENWHFNHTKGCGSSIVASQNVTDLTHRLLEFGNNTRPSLTFLKCNSLKWWWRGEHCSVAGRVLGVILTSWWCL